MSWRGRQIQTLLEEAISGGIVDVEWAAAWADGSALLVWDESIDWGNPLSPSLKGDAIFGLNDSKFWLSVSERHPTWINLAAYRDEADRRMFVLSSSHRDGEIDYRDPAISFSSSPSGVAVRVVQAEDRPRRGDLAVNWIDRTELDSLLGEFYDSGGLVMFVNCASVTSRSGLDSAIRRSVPLDPRIEGYLPNWDGLQDSMFGGLHQTEAVRGLIVFSHARSLRDLSQNVLTTLSDVLTSVASQLAEPKPGGAAMRLEFVFHDVP